MSLSHQEDMVRLRKIFYGVLCTGSILGVIMVTLMLVYTFQYSGGWSFSDPALRINIHIGMMLMFMIYLQGHASLIFRILPNTPKTKVKLVHGGLHLLGCIGCSFGFYAAVSINDNTPYSLHAWLGFAAVSLYYMQFLAGFISFLPPMTPLNVRLFLLPIHKVMGRSIFTLCCIAAATGLMMKAIGTFGLTYSSLPSPALMFNFAGIFLVCFAIIFGNLMADFRFRRPVETTR